MMFGKDGFVGLIGVGQSQRQEWTLCWIPSMAGKQANDHFHFVRGRTESQGFKGLTWPLSSLVPTGVSGSFPNTFKFLIWWCWESKAFSLWTLRKCVCVCLCVFNEMINLVCLVHPPRGSFHDANLTLTILADGYFFGCCNCSRPSNSLAALSSMAVDHLSLTFV